MTTREEIEAKCEELEDKYYPFAKADYSHKIAFRFGFNTALDLTWPMVEQEREAVRILKKALSEISSDFNTDYCDGKSMIANEALEAERKLRE